MKIPRTLMLMGIGAGLMYLMDQENGERRHAKLRDQAAALRYDLERNLDAASEQLAVRTRGVVAEASSRMQAEPVADETLVERIRAEIGRAVANPGSIRISAHEGRVTLSGPILASEVQGLVRKVRSVQGVERVTNRLSVHEEVGNVPGLQGAKQGRGMQNE